MSSLSGQCMVRRSRATLSVITALLLAAVFGAAERC